MLTSILNRDFQRPTDDWYALEVPGEHPNPAANVIQVIDPAAVDSIVRRFNQEADDYQARHGTPYPGMLIDIEHFKYDSHQETRAYGWLLRLENRDDVPYGNIRWTTVGQQAVDGGEYRFFSTEYAPQDLVVLNSAQPARVRPLRLAGLTLTNEPNNRGGKPITNRAAAETAPQNVGPSPKILGPTTETISTPALDAWFKVVEKVKRASAVHSSQSLNFQQSWQLAKIHFPGEYAAAFANVSDSNPSLAPHQDTLPPHLAQNHVADIANRIRRAAGTDYRFGFNFVRENLPSLFNRMNRPNLTAIESTVTPPTDLQNAAGRLFNRLVNEEQLLSRHTLSTAFQQVMDREPVLGHLAAGRLTLDQACADEPTLHQRLTAEIA